MWNNSLVSCQYTVIFTNKCAIGNNHLTFRGREWEALFFLSKQLCHQIYWTQDDKLTQDDKYK